MTLTPATTIPATTPTTPAHTAYQAFCRASRATSGTTPPRPWLDAWAWFARASRHGAPASAAYAQYARQAPLGATYARPADWRDLAPAVRTAYVYAHAAAQDAHVMPSPTGCRHDRWGGLPCDDLRQPGYLLCRLHQSPQRGWWLS